MAASNAIERTGVVKDGVTGEVFLPESRRPDGSIRKARRVKAGYVPQEEVPVYENKGVQWLKSKSDLPVGLSPEIMEKARAAKDAAKRGDDPPSEGHSKKRSKKKPKDTSQTKEPRQNKRNPKSAKKKEDEGDAVSDLLASVYGIKISEETPKKVNDNASATSSQEIDPAKKLKNLRKKLKSTEILEERLKTRKNKATQEELDKIGRKAALIAEIEKLQEQVQD